MSSPRFLFASLLHLIVCTGLLRAEEAFQFFEPIIPPRSCQVMAHRGMMNLAPENTKAALDECVNHGIEWAEVDIRLTRDGKHVLFHDDELDTKSSGHGPLANFNLDELRSLDFGSWFAPRFSRAKILTLAECLDLVRGRINLYLDCKVIDPALLVREVLEADMQKQVIVYDDEEIILKIRELSGGQIPVMTKWRREMKLNEWIARVHPEAVEIDAEDINPEIVATFHQSGIKVQAKVLGTNWDRPPVWQAMAEAGVDWLQTDLADEIIARLQWKNGKARPVLICAHRGANRYAPENTMPAFEKAVAFGVDYVEFDVRTSSDGYPFLLHDGKLDRTTSGTGSLSDLTSAQLIELDAGAWFGRPFEGVKIPKLDEFLSWSKGRILLYFDAKDIAPEALAQALERAGVTEQAVVYQGEDFLKRLKEINPAIKRMPPLDNAKDVERVVAELQPYFVDASWNILSAEMIEACHGRGIKVTSDAIGLHENIAEYTKAIEMGIDMIQTDYPLRVMEAVRLMSPR